MKIQQCLKVQDCQFKFSVFQQTKEANRLKVNKKNPAVLPKISAEGKSYVQYGLQQIFYLYKYLACFDTGNKVLTLLTTLLRLSAKLLYRMFQCGNLLSVWNKRSLSNSNHIRSDERNDCTFLVENTSIIIKLSLTLSYQLVDHEININIFQLYSFSSLFPPLPPIQRWYFNFNFILERFSQMRMISLQFWFKKFAKNYAAAGQYVVMSSYNVYQYTGQWGQARPANIAFQPSLMVINNLFRLYRGALNWHQRQFFLKICE